MFEDSERVAAGNSVQIIHTNRQFSPSDRFARARESIARSVIGAMKLSLIDARSHNSFANTHTRDEGVRRLTVAKKRDVPSLCVRVFARPRVVCAPQELLFSFISSVGIATPKTTHGHYNASITTRMVGMS